jgi:hypothetical protein
MLRPRQLLYWLVFTLLLALSTWLSGLAASIYYTHPLHQVPFQAPNPSPTYDALAIPTLPANPTQFDLGKNLYYYHCMPCHGDLGQGLIDSWRMVWEEDHRNCWGRGCHAGRLKDEGFPIPTVVPAVIGPTGLLDQYPDLDALVSYLHDTHPPQKPGKLKDNEYQSLAIFLWVSNNRPLPAERVSSATVQLSPTPTNTSPPPPPSSTRPASLTASQLPASASPALLPHTPAAPSLNARLMAFAIAAILGLLILILKIIKRSRP